ncbi:UNVERIFIED_CONTAM: hypothetical protein FKN15_032506 [Acipenser sinensis]
MVDEKRMYSIHLPESVQDINQWTQRVDTRKQAIWAAIQHKVNALGQSQRAIGMLKERTELKRKTKEKRSAATLTGGGPC